MINEILDYIDKRFKYESVPEVNWRYKSAKRIEMLKAKQELLKLIIDDMKGERKKDG